jgi:hypothetical protein
LTNVGMLQQQDNDLTNYQYSEKVDIGDKPLIVF